MEAEQYSNILRNSAGKGLQSTNFFNSSTKGSRQEELPKGKEKYVNITAVSAFILQLLPWLLLLRQWNCNIAVVVPYSLDGMVCFAGHKKKT